MSIVNFDSNIHNNEFWTRLKLKQFCSRSLAANVIAFRVLFINKKVSLYSMEELFYRKSLGDDFDYELFINSEMSKMPEIKNNNQNSGLIKNIINRNISDFIKKYDYR